jgi:predicted dithiol-disulfide oxidoreductase (DUF899 family)
MAQKFNNVIARLSFPGETAEYRQARDRLLEQEIELRRTLEAVAAQRRALPPGGLVPDYEFTGLDGHGEQVGLHLRELFAPGQDTLVVYNMMYGPEQDEGCPGCTSVLDGLNGTARHFTQRFSFAVVAASPLPRILEFARERGWTGDGMRFLSSAGTSYDVDYYGMAPDESRRSPMVNVFTLEEDGRVRHFWGNELHYRRADPGQHYRNNDLIHPVWGLMDLTPAGRDPEWMPAVTY